MRIELVIISLYLFSLPVIGFLARKKLSDAEDYFLGARTVKWYAVTFSIVAAETSTLTFISVPGLSYLTNMTFMQVVSGYILGRIIVAKIFLPRFYEGKLQTSYQFLEEKFGKRMRKTASVTFLFTRTAADGVRLFATAIPLKFLLDIDYFWAIVIIAAIALLYSLIGGMRSVIWVDVWQMFIYIGGAIAAGYFIVHMLAPDGLEKILTIAKQDGKLKIINLGLGGSFADFFKQPYTLFGGILGGMFLSMASHGTDQLIIQRLLSVGDLRNSQKAVVWSGIIVFAQMLLFLFIGLALYAFYGKLDVRADEIFVMFITSEMPKALTGIIIAGVFAAAISTIAGSINSMASSTIYDLFFTGKIKRVIEKNELLFSRFFSLVWALALSSAAMFFIYTSKSVVEIALGIASFTYSGLLGVFLAGIYQKELSEKAAIVAFVLTILAMIYVALFSGIGWTWYVLIGVIIFNMFSLILKRLKKFG